MEINVQEKLIEIFPKLQFELSDMQKKSIENVVVKEKNTLSILPTGGGKSLIYWLSGKILNGITIVVSPLIALMEEQAEKLEKNNCVTFLLHGQGNLKEQNSNLIKIAKGKFTPDFIFISPERLATDGMLEYCLKQRSCDIKLIVIDEVHCVSQWGESFRPFYKRINDFINNIFENNSEKAKILALTATINPKEINDICNEFKIETKDVIRDEALIRKEITLNISKFIKEDDKEEKLWNLFKLHRGEKILVYVYRKFYKRGVEELSKKANEMGFNSVYFHGDMQAEERKDIIDKYKKNEIDIVFATNAFGMGIDIEDIRVVIHYMIPETIEQYYQEIGRAARDANKGGTARAYLLYSNKNIEVKRQYFIDASYPNKEELIETYNEISNNKVGINTLKYFENDKIRECFPYFLEAGLIDIVCKGFSDFKNVEKIEDEYINDILKKTPMPIMQIVLSRNPEVNPKELVERFYEDIITGKIKLTKQQDKLLIINVKVAELTESKLNEILEGIEKKKEYRNNLLNYFVALLESNLNSIQLHQEIAKYLGVNKHQLNKIYTTSKGDLVRSKSEVIIANLLYEHNIRYEYEEKLFYNNKNHIEPDFTIYLNNGEKLYWEHLGMIGQEEYDKRWLEKLDIYEKYFAGKLKVTYESAALTDATLKLVKEIKEMNK
ncbi:MAG: RecQ family ATP-dependent DNA helicase [Clostridia bacterium]